MILPATLRVELWQREGYVQMEPKFSNSRKQISESLGNMARAMDSAMNFLEDRHGQPEPHNSSIHEDQHCPGQSHSRITQLISHHTQHMTEWEEMMYFDGKRNLGKGLPGNLRQGRPATDHSFRHVARAMSHKQFTEHHKRPNSHRSSTKTRHCPGQTHSLTTHITISGTWQKWEGMMSLSGTRYSWVVGKVYARIFEPRGMSLK